MIIINNEEALRVKCEDASIEEAIEIIRELDKNLIESAKMGRPGIGLAAPQIGIPKKVAIVRLTNIKLDLINCNIIEKYDPVIFKEEGCLSFPGRVENTTRYQEIVIDNNLNYPNKFIATGLLAVVCQHEIDHISSHLFMDRALPKKPAVKVGPNDPCICGKIDPLLGKVKKFKKCCGRNL